MHDGSVWNGRFYDYRIRFNNWGNSEIVKDQRSFRLNLNGKWDQFDKILNETRLISLPTDEKVPGLKEWVRRNSVYTTATYSVEYSTPNTYRFFIFQNPQATREHFVEAADFMRFHDYMFDIINNSDPLQEPKVQDVSSQGSSGDEKSEQDGRRFINKSK